MSDKKIRQTIEPVPNLDGVTKPQGQDLTANQLKALDEVLAHFSESDYKLSGVKDGEDASLKDEERFWLVRVYHSLFLFSLP